MNEPIRGRTLQTTTGDRTELHHGFHMITMCLHMNNDGTAHCSIELQTTADPTTIITPGPLPHPTTALTLLSNIGHPDHMSRLDVPAVEWEPARTEIGTGGSTLYGRTTGEDLYELRIVPATEVPK